MEVRTFLLNAKYAKYGFITATMDYTLLSKKNKKSSRMLDEIDFCISGTKNKLKY